MLVANARQMKLYDEYIMQRLNHSIEGMILKAAKVLYPYVAKEKNILILVGKGNNGADGLALSCLLKNMNQEVTCFLLASKKEMSQGAGYYLEKAIALGVSIYYLSDENDFSFKMFNEKVAQASVIIDGIFGIGLIGPLSGMEKHVIEHLNQMEHCPIMAIDIPSGLNADTGNIANVCLKASLTITFVAMKTGFLNPHAKAYTGEVFVESLGYDPDIMVELGFGYLLESEVVEKIVRERQYDGYKGTYGRVLLLTGSRQYPGAGLISTAAALYSGAGLVQLSSDAEVMKMAVSRYPEILTALADQQLDSMLDAASAVLFGCGRGWNDTTRLELEEVLVKSRVPVVLDADGINCLASTPELLTQVSCPVILTPHLGEMQRLLENETEKDPVVGAIQFARKYHAIVVLKGPLTMVTDGKHVFRNPSGNGAMASAGMGDALAGIVVSLLAQGYAYTDACVLGVYLHGCCGDQIAKNQYTVLASQLIEKIPEMMHRFNENTKK